MGATHVDCERMFEASEAMVPGGAHLVRRDFIGQDDDIGDPFEEAWANGRPTISTVHAMKGREADSVCFPYAASQFKNDYSLRMCYVAATRARSELTTTDGVFK